MRTDVARSVLVALIALATCAAPLAARDGGPIEEYVIHRGAAAFEIVQCGDGTRRLVIWVREPDGRFARAWDARDVDSFPTLREYGWEWFHVSDLAGIRVVRGFRTRELWIREAEHGD